MNGGKFPSAVLRTVLIGSLLVGAGALAEQPNELGDVVMNCGRWLIEPGLTQFEVLKKCGPPAARQAGDGSLWIYEQGIGQFRKLLSFDANGVLRNIADGERQTAR